MYLIQALCDTGTLPRKWKTKEAVSVEYSNNKLDKEEQIMKTWQDKGLGPGEFMVEK